MWQTGRRRRWLALAAASLLAAIPTAQAHHGWSWTDEVLFELKGKIVDVSIGNPHATLDVQAEGDVWRVELAPPSRTVAAGVTDDTVHVGQQVTAVGNRSKDHAEHRMKAVRLIVEGKTYDVYPDRVPTD